ncbi:MAG: bifunctional phosphopantothenoylcysteine decarboxylase/phosphopantothenate--cysteine ligase CoaBC [Acidimicrobiia bacterium]
MTALHGRRVVLGVSGGIAVYKAVEVCRQLVDAGAYVMPVLTEDSLRFVGALTFTALASEPARTSLFDAPEPIPHTHLGQTADLIVVVPATAKLLGKYAAGISDDLLTATLLATRAPVLVAPAMHTEMWEHPAVQENVATLRRRGVHVVGPESGRLAGGDTGEGRLAEPETIVAAAANVLAGSGSVPERKSGDFVGVRVLVTAGGTREPIDAVRVITNRSSGKQGYAVAEVAARRGAAVTLVTTIGRPAPPAVEIVSVQTAAEMQEAVLSRAADMDVIVQAAAVADFRPKEPPDHKLKKDEGVPDIVLEPTHDFSVDLGRAKRPGQVLVGFAAETSDLVANAARKLESKNLDLIVGNNVAEPDAGFEVDTNRAVILDTQGGVEPLPLQSKIDLAGVILDRVRDLLAKKDAP